MITLTTELPQTDKINSSNNNVSATVELDVSLSANSANIDKFEQLVQTESDSGDSDEIFEVERILDHHEKPPEFDKEFGRPVVKKEYLVKWKGYGPEYNSWEPYSGLQESCADTICEYEKKLAGQVHLLEMEDKILNSTTSNSSDQKRAFISKSTSKQKRIRRSLNDFIANGQFIYSLDSYPDFRIWGIDPPVKPTIRKKTKKARNRSRDRHNNKYDKMPDSQNIPDDRNFTYLLKHPNSNLDDETEILRIKSSDLQSTEYGQRQLCLYLEHLLLPFFEEEWDRLEEIKEQLPGMIRLVEPDSR